VKAHLFLCERRKKRANGLFLARLLAGAQDGVTRVDVDFNLLPFESRYAHVEVLVDRLTDENRGGGGRRAKADEAVPRSGGRHGSGEREGATGDAKGAEHELAEEEERSGEMKRFPSSTSLASRSDACRI
jgi:hypothetical protein